MKGPMDKMEKKCLLASVTLHAFLVLVVLVGSAFIIPKTTPPFTDPVRMIPSILIDQALSGGGGNPDKPRTKEVQKGNSLLPPVPVAEKSTPKPEIKVAHHEPTPEPPKVRAEPVKPKSEKKVEKAEKPTPKDKVPKETAATKPSKTPSKLPTKDPKVAPLELTPVVRSSESKKKKAEEAARAAAEKERAEEDARQARIMARQVAETDARLASLLRKTAERVQAGFSDGTVVDPGGDGAAAYAPYGAFIKAIYDEEWKTSRSAFNEDYSTTVQITVSRDGRVLKALIVQRSGNPVMDKSVQKALDTVKTLPPFPEASKDSERVFMIDFNLKAKKLTG
jgi:TonB family protein